MSSAYETGNYPPPGDSTSSGGYGSADTFTDPVQRGRQDVANSQWKSSLVDQSIGQEINDANQGSDKSSRQHFAHEAGRDFDRKNIAIGLNPYNENSDSGKEAREMLASRYADSRDKQYESGAAKGNDCDVGA
ncbi:hypothetical protein C8Q72DRAFT_858440 [Fomitopsis betulina]|nr:hypothetical protein C8Q72DRAFT_858440 [Fomitopsis betulina]